MSKRTGDLISGFLSLLFMLTFAIPVIPFAGFWAYSTFFETSCENLPVKYETERKKTDNLPKGEVEVSNYGEDGEREVCKRNNKVVSERVTQQPTNQLVLIGTHVDTQGITCEDVTSYDYNWDNDMLCTRPDGSTFYTSYEGANYYTGL